MSVIGYLRQCESCGVRMLVTIDDKTAQLCPSCFDQRLVDAIGMAIDDADDGDYPLGEVTA